jgi:hypothetical protein
LFFFGEFPMHMDDLKPLLWSAVGGGVAIVFFGFVLFGWVTAGSADKLAMEVSEDAVATRLAPICAAQAKVDPDYEKRLAVLMKTDSWRRGDAVSGFGWATIPGDKIADPNVAEKCALVIIPAAS